MITELLKVGGPVLASVVALYVAYLNGRRDRRARDREHEAEARQVLGHFTGDGVELMGAWPSVTVTNHTAMHVTDVGLVRAVSARFDEQSNELQFWLGKTDAFFQLVAPGESVSFPLQWLPSDEVTAVPALDPDDLFDPGLTISFRDGRGERWRRKDYGRPVRDELTIRAFVTWRNPIESLRGVRSYRQIKRSMARGEL